MYNRLLNSLIQKLLPGTSAGSPPNIFSGKLHEFLTCRHVSRYLNGKLIDADSSKFFEELSIKCMLRALAAGTIETWQLQLMFQELPSLLPLKYPAVGELKKACIQLIPQINQQYRLQNNWRRYCQYDYLLRMLQIE